jgi:ribosomal protein S18 acetylase RimI-like enzyme
MTTFELGGAERLDEVRELWLQLHHHHRRVAVAQPLVADDELSWKRRRALYLERLRGGEDFLALARDGSSLVGYAMVTIELGPDDTFPLGDRYAEVYSMSVAEDARGRGIGTQLLDFVERELVARGIHDLKIAVMVGNADALRFYERRGMAAAELVLYRFGSSADQDSATSSTSSR